MIQKRARTDYNLRTLDIRNAVIQKPVKKKQYNRNTKI